MGLWHQQMKSHFFKPLKIAYMTKITSLLRKINVFDPKDGKRKLASYNLLNGEVHTSDGQKSTIENFQDVKYYEKYQNGKIVKERAKK